MLDNLNDNELIRKATQAGMTVEEYANRNVPQELPAPEDTLGIMPDILKPTNVSTTPVPASTEMNPVVKKYLLDKKNAASRDVADVVNPQVQSQVTPYNNPFSDSERNKVKSEMESKQSNLALAQLASSIGDALARKDNSGTQNYFNKLRDNIKDETLNDFDKRKKQSIDDAKIDPNSSQSQAFRKIIEAQFPNIAKSYGDSWQNVTASDKENIFEPLKLKENIEARKEQMRILSQSRQDALDQKMQTKNDKKLASMNEIEDRRQNINTNLEKLKQMVKDDGTYEVFGSHNQDMDRLTEQIATDMAKLMDPNSVARPSEVEAVKKTLIRSGFSNMNSTAEDILKNFKNEVNIRADSAYKIRGLVAPSGRPQASEGNQPAMSQEDITAVKWAKSNPNDPNSKLILKINGM